ncbi:MAG: transglutaminase [Muricauda sp.]|nr:transglutaminase domain-containing protein [Allomuricauda sp.]MAU26276.1 transglutaminase [Allomuricauda sp.]MBC32055.1 transglutaminase [Allomuricauda sp.]|tara:strand:+ start:1752 stop:3692 length:1941 start_codon:yes stop_codon:yes gene_type:complete
MMNRILLLGLILTLHFASAQEVKFGKISKEELLEKEYAPDRSANAAILYKNQKTYFLTTNGVNSLVTEIHERIKIYNKEGFEYATETIDLFKTRYDDELVRKIKAVTYNLKDGEIVEDELDKDQIFKTEASYNYNQVKFTMPNVQEGSVIEFMYVIKSPFIWNIDEFQFQYDIPVKQMIAELRTPKGFHFKQTPKGYYNVYPKTSTSRDNRIGMDVVINKYHAVQVPAMKKEAYVDNIDNYRSGVMFELVYVDIPGYYKSFAQSWGDVAKTIGNSDDYKNELDKTKSFDDELDAVITGKSSQIDKMKAIFKHVKNTITWNGRDGKYFQYGLKKALKEKKGNAADINLLMVAMLRYAGIDANPVVISTKENAIPFFPTLDRLNYVIAYANIDGKQYFLDATEEFSDINVLPVKDYNWKGMLIDNQKMVWQQINVISPKQSNKLYSVNLKLSEDGSCEGTYKSRFDRHSAFAFRKNFKNTELDSYLSSMEEQFSGIEIDGHEVKNADVYEGPVSESFKFYNDYAADVIDGKLYFEPLSFMRMEENPFKSEERMYPIDFGYPFKDTYMVNVDIPEGYVVESKPEPIVVKLPNDLGRFKYILSDNGSKINVLVNFEINRAILSPDLYPILREFFKQIIAKESEKVVLAKA